MPYSLMGVPIGLQDCMSVGDEINLFLDWMLFLLGLGSTPIGEKVSTRWPDAVDEAHIAPKSP